MMKLVLVALAVFAVSNGSALPRHGHTFGLKEDFDDFMALIPREQVLNIVIDYIQNDAEVQETLQYIVSEDFKQLILDIEGVKPYREFLAYLQESGLNVYHYINELHDFIGLAPYEPRFNRGLRRGQGVRDMLNEIEALIPFQKFKKLFNEKMENSPAFAQLIERMSSEEFKGIIHKLGENPRWQELVQRARDQGVDVELVRDVLNRIFGWGIKSQAVTYGLKEDFNDFMALIPKDQVNAIVMDYVQNDEEVQHVLTFIASQEFRELVLAVDAVPEYINFLNYLQGEGLDVYKVVNKFHDLLELPHLTPPSYRSGRRGVGIRGMLDDIEALLPIEEIKALYYEKLQTSDDFIYLVTILKGDDFKDMINKLRANPTFRDIIVRLISHGVDVQRVVDLLNKIFGWGLERKSSRSTRGLKEDFTDFVNLLPQEEIASIAIDYIANDEEVQEVIEYLQSDDFKKLVLDVDAVPEYIEFLNYLQNQGLNVYEVVNKIHDLLELPHLTPPAFRRLPRRGTGIRGLIDDIKAILPLDKIKALYHEKLETSPEFKALIEMMRGEEFKNLMKRLEANPTFQEIIARAKAHGVDIELIVDLLNTIFGWGLESKSRRSTRGLEEDFRDFMNLLPQEEIASIAIDYIANDEEVQEVIEYLQSDDFKKLVLDVDAVPEYIEFLNYLQNQGLNVYEVVNKIHDLLELPHLTPPAFRRLARRGTGIRGLIDDIKAILPLDKIKALYHEKLEPSPEFKALIEMMRGEEFKNLMKRLEANPTFQEIIARAKAHGVDIELIVDLLNTIFGWGLESKSRRSTRGLEEDFRDFMNLLPQEEIASIAIDYIANDEEVQEVIEYLQSDDFKKLVLDVDVVPEYIEFLNYLQNQGLNVYEVVNKIHDLLELPPLTPPVFRRLARRGTGIRGLIDDIKAILPLDKIKALYHEKLETSPEFKALIEMMRGEEFTNLMKRLEANPTFQEIIARAKARGVDIELIVDLLNTIFGWGIEGRYYRRF